MQFPRNDGLAYKSQNDTRQEVKMKDKVAVITGSTSGIGLEIAKHFAKLESKIVINGFTKKKR
ncbi:hypothetical protein KNCP2_01730 [Candidatus Rickettsia kedanie]|uniref:Uncharacterized protein n=1 Tax=Candidatus Rickettsia kedanie TaxID=3115352 RepID=A0ABP9TWZ3_9RICK